MHGQGILLKAGINELEVMDFQVGDQKFGINVLKVQRILIFEELEITRMRQTHASVDGVFLYQDKPIHLVNLRRYMGLPEADMPNQVVLICEFNQATNGFLVDRIRKIHRLSWADIQPLSPALKKYHPQVTGVTSVPEGEVLMLDVESVMSELNGINLEFSESDVDLATQEKRKLVSLYLADDAEFFRDRISKLLVGAYYTNVSVFDNGQAVFNALQKKKQMADQSHQHLEKIVVVTDIEMPQMDGLTLCKQIKQTLPHVPVIVVSSMISKQMVEKCRSVGADENINKMELGKLVAQLDRYCL